MAESSMGLMTSSIFQCPYCCCFFPLSCVLFHGIWGQTGRQASVWTSSRPVRVWYHPTLQMGKLCRRSGENLPLASSFQVWNLSIWWPNHHIQHCAGKAAVLFCVFFFFLTQGPHTIQLETILNSPAFCLHLPSTKITCVND